MLQIDYERLCVYNLWIITSWEERGEEEKGKFKVIMEAVFYWKYFPKKYIFGKYVVR